MPTDTCKYKLTKGISTLNLNNYTQALVVTPKNHISNKKYPLLVVYAPSGKSAKKSEKFYKKSKFGSFQQTSKSEKGWPEGQPE